MFYFCFLPVKSVINFRDAIGKNQILKIYCFSSDHSNKKKRITTCAIRLDHSCFLPEYKQSGPGGSTPTPPIENCDVVRFCIHSANIILRNSRSVKEKTKKIFIILQRVKKITEKMYRSIAETLLYAILRIIL